MGTYNHAVQATVVNDTFVVAWHNGAHDEDGSGGRVLASASATMDPTVWSADPVELFGPLAGVTLSANNTGAWVYGTG